MSVIGVVMFFGCERHDDSVAITKTKDELDTIEVEVVRVTRENWPSTVRTQGSLFADEVTTVGAKVTGRVVQAHVDLGDKVKADEPLVTLDQREYKLQVLQADSQLAQARSAVGLKADSSLETLEPENAPPVREARAVWQESQQQIERLKELREQDAISDAEFDTAVAAERVAEARYASSLNAVREKIALIGVRDAELELAREKLRETVILAPFDCVVQNRMVAPGAFIQVGQPVVSIVRTSVLRFRGTMPERYVHTLKIGQPVRLVVDSQDEPITINVSRISPSLDEMSRSLLFEALVDNSEGQLRSGLFCEAEVEIDESATALCIPPSAVIRFAGVDKVWGVVGGVTKEFVVQLGRTDKDRVEIVNGISEGVEVLREATKGRVANVKVTNATTLATQETDKSAASNTAEKNEPVAPRG